VIVDRTSNWGNPFNLTDATEAGYTNPRRACVSHFAAWLSGAADYPDVYTVGGRRLDRRWMREHLPTLAGRNVCCPCRPDEPCHGDVLLRLANPSKFITRREST
jgi:hypothetical protein